MLTHNPITLAAPTRHLQQFNQIRSLLLVILWIGLGINLFLFNVNVVSLSVVLTALTTINILTFLRLKNSLDVTEIEFFIQLIIDVITLISLFFFSGGANNPFISYLLVPICIAAATLTWRFTIALTAISLIGYTALLFFYKEFPLFSLEGQHHHSGFNWHILGMWFNFFISAILISYFIVKMAASLRQQQETLSRLREDELRNEQLMAVAMLAAGTAHEINTPLSTMTVLLSELRNDYEDNEKLLADIHLLSQQVNLCATTLKRLVADSSSNTQGHFKTQSIRQYCDNIIDRWQLMRPTVHFTVSYLSENLETLITLDPRLEQAITNLLNNAADASPNNVKVEINVHNQYLIWSIFDQGSGITSSEKKTIGKTLYSTKTQGLGLGMVITQATLNKFGGHLEQHANSPTGTITCIKIPLHS